MDEAEDIGVNKAKSPRAGSFLGDGVTMTIKSTNVRHARGPATSPCNGSAPIHEVSTLTFAVPPTVCVVTPELL